MPTAYSAIVACGAVAARRLHARATQRLSPRIVSRGEALASDARLHELSIVTYNVLCARFATRERLPHVAPPFLEYSHRWALLARELAEFGSDLVLLQEVTIDRWGELQALMASFGYNSLVQGKQHEVVLAVFWRAARLELRWSEERSRALLVELELRGGGTDAERREPGGREGETSQAAQPENKRVYVVNVHLEGAPYRPTNRVAQLRHALQRLERHIQSQGLDPDAANLVVAGDLNSDPEDPPCRLLRDGGLEAGAVDGHVPGLAVTGEAVAHPFRLREVYEAAAAVPPFTRKAEGEGSRPDFMFASKTMAVVAVLRPLPSAALELVLRSGLPNRALPSDHLPLGAVLRLGG